MRKKNNERSLLGHRCIRPAIFLVLAWCYLLPVVMAAETIRFGILSIAPPQRVYSNWQPFANYLARKSGVKVEIVVPRGFDKLKQMIATGDIDLFYVNSYVFYRLKQAGHVKAVAQMENVAGKVTSASDFFVRSDSEFSQISDLKDKRVAFVSPMGAGGFLAPRARLATNMGGAITVQEVFSGNLSSSIHLVLLGKVDAGTMCGVNFKLMQKKIDTGELRIISVSEAYPENVLGAHVSMSKKELSNFFNIIVDMVNDEQGRDILTNMSDMKIKRFLPYKESIEAVTRRLIQQSGLTVE